MKFLAMLHPVLFLCSAPLLEGEMFTPMTLLSVSVDGDVHVAGELYWVRLRKSRKTRANIMKAVID